MKVLLLFPMADGQTGPAIKYAFEQLGHEVVAVDAKRAWRKSYEVSLQVKPNLVFCSRTRELASQIAMIKRAFKNVIICMWNVDGGRGLDSWKHLFPLVLLCNYHFIADIKILKDWRTVNVNTHFLLQGVQNEIYKKPIAISAEDKTRYSCEVCFCGERRGFREPFLSAMEQMDVKFKYWGGAGRPRIVNEEHNKMVALSKINLGCSGQYSIGAGVSVRDFKILGAGGFLLTDCDKVTKLMFPCNSLNRVLDCYNSPSELISKVRYWLKNEGERKRIAEQGYKWVHANATYTHRIQQALDYMKERLC